MYFHSIALILTQCNFHKLYQGHFYLTHLVIGRRFLRFQDEQQHQILPGVPYMLDYHVTKLSDNLRK